MLKLQSAFWHIVTLTPFLNPGDVVIDLQATLPRQEVSAHEKIVEGCNANQFEKFGDRLSDDRVFKVICLHRLEHVVEQTQQVVHTERRRRIALEKLAKEPITFIGNESRKGLRLNDCRDDHLLQRKDI